MKVYIVIELKKDIPNIIGVFKNKSKAEKMAYSKDRKNWTNIIEKELEE